MDFLVYASRTLLMLLATFAGVRIIGRKSISEMTSYDLAALMLLTTVAAEPLVFKVTSKATFSVLLLAGTVNIIGILSLRRFFYNLDLSPVVLVSNGKMNRRELRKARMNTALLLSQLRQQGYTQLKDVAFAILEPMGKLSVIPKSQNRPVQPQDINVPTNPAGMGLPLIIDGFIIKGNLQMVNFTEEKLASQLEHMGVRSARDVFFCQVDDSGNLWVDLMSSDAPKPELP